MFWTNIEAGPEFETVHFLIGQPRNHVAGPRVTAERFFVFVEKKTKAGAEQRCEDCPVGGASAGRSAHIGPGATRGRDFAGGA